MQETNEALVGKIKAGIDIPENMLRLWEQNRGFIGKTALSYKGYEEMEDLIQQGYIGLCSAVDGYRMEENVPFINYAAFWIRQSIRWYIENCGGVVKIPEDKYLEQGRYKKMLREFEMGAGREPTDREACRYMGMTMKKLEDLKRGILMREPGSLDKGVGDDGEETLGELVPGDGDTESAVLDRMEREELRQILWPMVDGLPDIQPQVIRSLYLEGQTLKQTGERVGATPERVRAVKQNALSELRKPGRSRKLRPFLPETVKAMAYRHNGVEEFNRTWTSSTERAALNNL